MARNMKLITVEANVRLRFALREALHKLDFKETLPIYLTDALLRFNDALAKQIVRQLLVPKIEGRHRAAGKPRTKVTRGKSSLEGTAEDLGLSISTVERAVYEHIAKAPRASPEDDSALEDDLPPRDLLAS